MLNLLFVGLTQKMPPKKESKPAGGSKAGGKSGGKGAKAAEDKGTYIYATTVFF